jgi:murein DD-endopeptidase MepM/ murein hydrolase activator NlpD
MAREFALATDRRGRTSVVVISLALLALVVALAAVGRSGGPGASSNEAVRVASPEGPDAPPDLAAAELVVEPTDSAGVSWEPAQVEQGTLFRVRIEEYTGSVLEAQGTFSGEPLHFRREGDVLTALAAAPVSEQGEVELQLELRYESAAAEIRFLRIPVVPGDYRMERLTVAPEFGRPQPPEIQARINDESARAIRVSRRSHDTERTWEAPFLPPRETRITSGFGHGRMFNDEVQSRHMGTDFSGAVGEPVLAPARGVVALVDTFYLGGNVIYLDHGDGLVTAYLHLSSQEVTEGDVVEPGQVIGRVGATGRVTGPHLHWIVRYGEITVDGLSLLEL